MTAMDILENKYTRVRLPQWPADTYLNIIYDWNGEPLSIRLVSPTSQAKLKMPVGMQNFTWEEAFSGNFLSEDYAGWELFQGTPYPAF